MARVEVLGVHLLPCTDALIEEAIEEKYGPMDEYDGDPSEAEAHVREELGSVALIEAVVTGRDAKFDLGEFGQDDQVPWEEVYLSSDGEQAISRGFDVPPGDNLRITFYLHYFNPAAPLATCYGSVVTPPPTPMPERLARLAPYTPVD